MSIDPHRLAEERSIAYHRAIAERIRRDPVILARARERVRDWLAGPGEPRHYALAWQEILQRNEHAIAAFLTDRGEEARELRQSTPFAGALTARERWALWRLTLEEQSGAA